MTAPDQFDPIGPGTPAEDFIAGHVVNLEPDDFD